MLLKAYSIFDAAAKAYMQPFFVQSDGVAIRIFQNQVNKKEEGNNLYKFPEQFTLFKVGAFEDDSGNFTVGEPHSLGNGAAFQDNSGGGNAVSDEQGEEIKGKIKEVLERLEKLERRRSK